MQLKRQTILLTTSLLFILIGQHVAIAETNPLHHSTAATPPSTTQAAGNDAGQSLESVLQAATTPPSTTQAAGNAGGDARQSLGIVLQAIKINTDLILQKINNLPNFLIEIKDNLLRTQVSGKKPEALLFSTQQYMDSIGQLFQYGIIRNPNFTDSNSDNIDAFNNYLLKLQKEGFASSQSLEGKMFDSSSFNPDRTGLTAIEQVIPNVNALAYTNAIGFTPLTPTNKPDPTWTDTYIKAASGANLFHAKLLIRSNKVTIPQKQYQSYFNLTYAVQSFNTYILGKYILNNNILSQNQSVLYRKASSSDYLSTIATEPMGYVFRDTLLFQSQQYVLIAKLVELQRETLMAQTMTNALLIAANRQEESVLYDKTLSG